MWVGLLSFKNFLLFLFSKKRAFKNLINPNKNTVKNNTNVHCEFDNNRTQFSNSSSLRKLFLFIINNYVVNSLLVFSSVVTRKENLNLGCLY